jgi:hypothetical protein
VKESNLALKMKKISWQQIGVGILWAVAIVFGLWIADFFSTGIGTMIIQGIGIGCAWIFFYGTTTERLEKRLNDTTFEAKEPEVTGQFALCFLIVFFISWIFAYAHSDFGFEVFKQVHFNVFFAIITPSFLGTYNGLQEFRRRRENLRKWSENNP